MVLFGAPRIAKKYAENVEKLHWSEERQMYFDSSTNGTFEEHVGYVSLFPLMLGVTAPDSPRLSALLDALLDEAQLYTPHGVRSLSKQDAFFANGEDYWRGHIWMNCNYMILSSLKQNYWNSKDKRTKEVK